MIALVYERQTGCASRAITNMSDGSSNAASTVDCPHVRRRDNATSPPFRPPVPDLEEGDVPERRKWSRIPERMGRGIDRPGEQAAVPGTVPQRRAPDGHPDERKQHERVLDRRLSPRASASCPPSRLLTASHTTTSPSFVASIHFELVFHLIDVEPRHIDLAPVIALADHAYVNPPITADDTSPHASQHVEVARMGKHA